jgi:hypothetical protein
MKKVLVIILLSISACPHKSPIEKVKPVITQYLDTVRNIGFISDINSFKQVDKYSFTCEFRIKEMKTGFPYYARGYFKLDSDLLRVTRFNCEIH